MFSQCGYNSISCEKPKTPAEIRMASDNAQQRQMAKICYCFNPCFNTKAFCAPMAIIWLKPMASPCLYAFNIDMSYHYKNTIIFHIRLLNQILGFSNEVQQRVNYCKEA